MKLLSKETKRKILYIVAPRLAWMLMWGIYLTCKKKFLITQEMRDENFIAAFWHGECVFLPFLYRAARKQFSKERNKGFYIISSEHFDGDIMVKLYGYFDLLSIRGSSTRSGLKVLIESFKLIRDGYDMGITPDGPKGPYHSVADGVVAMSKKTGKKIVPLRVDFSSYWTLPTWDRAVFPKPFSTMTFHCLDGFHIDENMSLEDAKELIKSKMEAPLNNAIIN